MRAASLILLCALGACSSEPSFDERYEAQSEKIGAAANGMALELGNQLNASVAAGRLDVDANAQTLLTSPVAAQ